jgi:hypothetical protein
VQELNFPEFIVGDVKLKMKTTRTRYAAELAKVTKSEESGAGLHDTRRLCTEIVLVQTSTFIPAWRLYSTNHISTVALFLNNISTFID